MLTIIAMIVAYLIGSLSSAIIVCKILRQPDPRTEGSLNPGATNVLRIAGKKAAAITLAGDILKGFIAVLIGRLLFLHGLELGFVVLAVALGHMYPVFFKFQGGKGVATLLGAITALSPLVGIITAITWIIIAAIFRYSSLAAMVSATLMPFYAFFFSRAIYFLALIPVVLLLLWRHKDNIKRLKEGTEPKIEF